jgi:hypothetical protein
MKIQDISDDLSFIPLHKKGVIFNLSFKTHVLENLHSRLQIEISNAEQLKAKQTRLVPELGLSSPRHNTPLWTLFSVGEHFKKSVEVSKDHHSDLQTKNSILDLTDSRN